MVPFLIWRLIDEEHLLVRDLPGYEAYRRQVRYRLVPFLWWWPLVNERRGG
jgi:protein-S-isoprenylcysteine O-methyltransferase Ste14